MTDLKPENILLTFDYKKNEIVDLKLCDFGLGAYFEPKVQLTDFCGSPGTCILTLIKALRERMLINYSFLL